MADHAGSIKNDRFENGSIDNGSVKSLAKTVARDTTCEIADRHLRARVRTRCYNQVLQVLNHLEDRRARQLEAHRRTLTRLGAAALLLGAGLVLSLTL